MSADAGAWRGRLKRDLHCHIDGSVSLPLLEKLAGRPVPKEEAAVPPECDSLTEYLKRFDLPVSLMQTENNLREISCDVIRQAWEDRNSYIEMRFCPMLHTREGLTEDLVIEAVLSGMAEGEKRYGVRSQLILCGHRNLPIDESLRMLDTAEHFISRGVCAVDLAGDESHYSNKDFEDFFKEVKRRGLPLIVHSGETGNVENVRMAIDYGALRIGHGIALIKDPDLMREAARKRIGIELCPSSNLQTRAIKALSEYPLPAFLEAGISASLNTDNRTVTDTTLSGEFDLIYDYYRDDSMMNVLIDNAEETSTAGPSPSDEDKAQRY